MKKIFAIIIAIAVAVAVSEGHAQTTTTSFDVKITGNGKQAIIFIPGFACSGDVWNETRVNYEKNYTCYTLTMAGFAGVPAEAAPSFKSWEVAIVNYITQKNIIKPVIIGHSMGGGLALAMAEDYPDLLSKIVIVDALPCLSAANNPSYQPDPNADCGPMIDRMMNMNDSQFQHMQELTMPQLMDDTLHIKQVIQWSVKSDRNTFAKIYCNFLNTDLRPKLHKVKIPALVLLEHYFSTFKLPLGYQYNDLKGAQIFYAPKGRHFIMYDDTDWYNNQLANFIK